MPDWQRSSSRLPTQLCWPTAASATNAASAVGDGLVHPASAASDRSGSAVGPNSVSGDRACQLTRQRTSRWSPSVRTDSMETERPSSRVTFSRGEDNKTREFDPMQPSDVEGMALPANGLAESTSLPNISASSTKAQRKKHRKHSRRARPAPRQPKGSHVGTVDGACTGRGLPRVSARASFSGPLEPLGLEYEGFSQGISFSASARNWGLPARGVEDAQDLAGTTRPLPAPVMDMPTRLFARESDLMAAEKRYVDHVTHVQQARRMIDVQTPYGYRAYRSRHENAERSSDGLHSWLARPGMASSLAPLSKMTLPRRRRPTGGFGRGFGAFDPDASALDDFYAQMQAIEQQMHHSPLCLAHEVMARLGPGPVPGLDDEAAYVDAAATKIQSIARGRLARRDLAEQENAARMIQARVRGFQTRAERREEAIREAKAAAEEAAAIYAKEEAEAVAAEAAYAKEEAEALAAEAAHRKEEAEALAAEADARREEEEALLAEANARREEAEAVEAEKVADKEEEEARIATEIAHKETEEARIAQAAAQKEQEEARIAEESALKEEEEARLAAEVAAKEEAEAEAARALAAKEEEEARLALERKAKEDADVEAAEKALADAVASGDAAAIAAATTALQKEKDEAAAAALEAEREQEEAASAKATAEREAAEAKEAAETAAKEKAEAVLAAEVLAKEKAEAEEATRVAEKEQQEADEAQKIAEKEQAEAEEARRNAEKERAEAEEAAAVAERERREAEEAKIIAAREREEAEAARIIAEKERAEAEAARIVAVRERAEADAAKAEADRLAAIAKALEEEADEEKFAHQAALAAVTMPDIPPPERFVKKKKGFGRGLLKMLAGARDRGLPPGLHVRMMGTKRPTPSYGDNAMLVTLEFRNVLNIKGLMPELLVENGLARPYSAMQLLPSSSQAPASGNVAKAADGALTTGTAAVPADTDSLTWNTSFLVEVEDVTTEHLVGGIYLEANKSGDHEQKVAAFSMVLAGLVPNKPVDAWVDLTPAPPTLHLKLSKLVTPGGGAAKLMVDVLNAYGDMDCGEIPDPYVKLHMEANGVSENKQSQVVDNDMTPSWNESFVFNCSTGLLTCTIWDKDLVGKDDLLGTFIYDVSQVATGEDPVDVWLESTTHKVARALIG